MNAASTSIAYGETGFYSRMILDYLAGDNLLTPFYTHLVSKAGIKAAIENRKTYETNRRLLVNTLKKHYAAGGTSNKQEQNIQLLNNPNCFTVTTAHQPNIFTGHLYFIYKILHTIKLCEKLKADMPENDFVPVYYMGSEDADLEELGHIYINGIKHSWQTDQTGAVGRMKVDKALIGVLEEVAGELTIHPFGEEIIQLMKSCYTEGTTIEQATFKLVNDLFCQYGLLVLLPDDADYKRAFNPVVEKELKDRFSHPIVASTVEAFPKQYKVQAGGRDLNLFYLQDNSRERIEAAGDKWTVVNTDVSFTEPEILKVLEDHPERFSANVILRPVFQEMILPNIVFIGGGGEIAYWLELKGVFDAVKVPFPVLLLRNSFMLVEKSNRELASKLALGNIDLFKPANELLNLFVKRNSKLQLSLDNEKQEIQHFYAALKKIAGTVDITLEPHTGALEKLALKKIEALEKKMLRAEKKKFEAQQRQLNKLKARLFPHDSLQERIENFMLFYAKWGSAFLKTLYENSPALDQQFTVLEEQ